MTQYLPPNLLALFAPRDLIPFLPPADKLPHEKKSRGYLGVGNFLGFFEKPTTDDIGLTNKIAKIVEENDNESEDMFASQVFENVTIPIGDLHAR